MQVIDFLLVWFRLCPRCNAVHHWRSLCGMQILPEQVWPPDWLPLAKLNLSLQNKIEYFNSNAEQESNCSQSDSDQETQKSHCLTFPDERDQRKNSDSTGFGVTPFRKEIRWRTKKGDPDIGNSSAVRQSICFSDAGNISGMARERRGVYQHRIFVWL